MNVKTIAQFLAISWLVSCHAFAMSVPSGGCYQCEDEVWEEVKCEDLPQYNSTTEGPSTTSTTASPASTTTSTTTTTPKPAVSTTESPYRKCYCECKVGCKEFCRKVTVNPELKKQILQVSKITEPIAQGRLESTHYHQRELIPKQMHHHKSHRIHEQLGNKAMAYVLHPAGGSLHHKTEAMPNHHHTPMDYNNEIVITKHLHQHHPNPFEAMHSKHHHTDHSHYDNNIELSIGSKADHPRLSYPSMKHSPIGYDSVETYIKDFVHDSPMPHYNSHNGFDGHHDAHHDGHHDGHHSMAYR